VKHLDLSYILQNVSDDPAFVRMLLEVFLKDLEKDVPDLTEAVASEDHDHIRKSAHRVKSGFRSLGMTHMTEYLQQLEDMGKTEASMASIRVKFDGFLTLLPEVHSEIDRYQEEHPA
jgi:HPt (histidine-containing phosphotransfer) domain-containing protein